MKNDIRPIFMMKRAVLIILAILISSTVPASAQEESAPAEPAAQEAPVEIPPYTVGPGDSLEISVWRHPDLETKAIVKPDGKISFPLVGDIYVNEMTTDQIKDRIAIDLAKTINNPVITVNITSLKSKKIFILGEVNSPGAYIFEGNVTVVDAISKAGGYKVLTAALGRVIVIKGGYSKTPKKLRLNIWETLYQGDTRENILLDPGDIVCVPTKY